MPKSGREGFRFPCRAEAEGWGGLCSLDVFVGSEGLNGEA